METPDISENEQAKHDEAIESLCNKHPEKTDFIRNCYLEILEKVSHDATIRTYLTILITREVEALLRIQELTRGTQVA